jgi:iron complex outermembrane receptor protein
MPHYKIHPLRSMILLALAGCQTLATAYAAEGDSATSSNAAEDKIIVTETNTALKISTPLTETPRALTEISQEQLQERGVKKMDEALRYSTGVLATPYGADNKSEWLKVRGFEWSSYLNGLKTLKENGFYNWIQEPYGTEQLVVLKGPSSMLYGQNPPGGLVNTIVKKPKINQQNEITVSYGNNNYRNLGFDSTGPLSDDNSVLYRVVGFSSASTGPTRGARTEHYYIAPSLTFNLSYDTELTILTSFAKDNTNPTSGFKTPYGSLHNTPYGKIDRKASLGEPGYTKNDTEQMSLGYELKHDFNETWKFQQSVNYSYIDLYLRNVYVMNKIDDRNASRGVTYRNGSAQSWAVDNRMIGYWEMDRHENTLLIGLDYFNANSRGEDANYYGFSPIDIFNPQHGQYAPMPQSEIFSHQTNRDQYGVYVQNQFKYDNYWLFLLGGRFDRAVTSDTRPSDKIEITDNKFSKTAGLMYLADNGLYPYISYAESFSPEAGRDGYNTPYKPTEGKQLEAGLKYSPEDFDGYINASIYQLSQKNTLTSDPVTFISTQTGKSRARGFELEAANQLTRDIKLLANYTYSDVVFKKSKNPEEEGKRLPLIPKHSASMWLDYSFNGVIDGLTVGTGVRYVGSTQGDKVNSADMKVPSYTLVDAMVRYDVNKQWQVQVNANNIVDKKYVSACDYWCYYGDGRTVTAKVNYRW